MLPTGQLLGPAPNPASQPRTGAPLPGTLASPRAGLAPAGCPQLVARLRHNNLLVVMAPKLLDAPPERRLPDSGRQAQRDPTVQACMGLARSRWVNTSSAVIAAGRSPAPVMVARRAVEPSAR